MITVVPADIVKIAPEYADFIATPGNDVLVTQIIEVAQTFVCEDKWGETKGKLGVQYMTAHIMKSTGFGDESLGSEVAGPVTQEKVGDLSRSYAQLNLQNGSTSDQLLSSTAYGRMFIMLRKTLVVTPMVT